MVWLPQLLYQSYLFLSDLVISLLILEAWVELVMHLSALAPTKKTKKQTLFLKAQYPITWVIIFQGTSLHTFIILCNKHYIQSKQFMS